MRINLVFKWKLILYPEEKNLINESLDLFFNSLEHEALKDIKYKLKYDHVVTLTGRELSTVIRALRNHEESLESKLLSKNIQEFRDKLIKEKEIEK